MKQSTYNQKPCENCGEIGPNHEKVKVFTGNSRWKHLHCPDGSGLYQP